MSAVQLKSPSQLNQSWKDFKRSWELFSIAASLSEKGGKIQVAALLRVAGQAAQQWFETFSFENADDKDKLECVLDKFQEYCEPKKNITVERYLFNSRDQKAG